MNPFEQLANAVPNRFPAAIGDLFQKATAALGPPAGRLSLLVALVLLAVFFVLAAWGTSPDPCPEADPSQEPTETIDPALPLTFREAMKVVLGIALAAALFALTSLM